MVIAGNEYLAGAVRRVSPRPVEVVPSCVEPSDYLLHRHDNANRVTVGWIGSASTAPYLADVLRACERINRDSVVVRLIVVGGNVSYSAPWIEVRPWSLRREAADVAEFDIGVMPMPDNEWTRGKCGYKLLQYFAAGVPAIASPVGVASKIVGSERGLFASTESEWVSAIKTLAADPEMRREAGANAREFVEREYSYERWAPELARLISDLA